MVSKNNEVKLIDFGLSIVNSGQNQEDELAGTIYYMAPEVFTYNYGAPCDIWALGVSLFYMLTGKLPFKGKDAKDL